MWYNSLSFKKDLDFFSQQMEMFLDFFKNKTILISGATGLLGKTLVFSLFHLNEKFDLKLKIIALVRNTRKAEEVFSSLLNSTVVKILTIGRDSSFLNDVDLIVHAASPTESSYFVTHPVETVESIFNMTDSLLSLAKENSASFIFLSTMEVYGNPLTEDYITEDHASNLNNLDIRSSYPEAKRLAETLVASYAKEYSVDAKIIRLTQTFGPGVEYDDKRVFAEFARCIIEKKDIVLKTKGDTKRCYLYTIDAITAIFYVLFKGKAGEAYNAANIETYCSIYDMATYLIHSFNSSIKVLIKENDDNPYTKKQFMKLDVQKLCSLGWKAHYNLRDMYLNMIEAMSSDGE